MRSSISGLLLLVMLCSAGPLHAEVIASSTLQVSGKSSGIYSAQNIADGDLQTVWIEGKEGSGIGESFALDLPRASVVGLEIFAGHSESERMCKKYARLKEVSITFFTLSDTRELQPIKQQNVSLEDVCKLQRVSIEEVKVGGELFGGQARVTLRSVYPGEDFQDAVVGEARILLKEFPAQQAVPKGPVTLKGSDLSNLNDGEKTTTWISEGEGTGAALTLEAPDYGLAAVVITPGEPRAAKAPKKYASPKDVTIEVQGRQVKFTLQDSLEPQRIELPAAHGYSGSLFGAVKITVDSVYPGKLPNLAITEITLIATQLAL